MSAQWITAKEYTDSQGRRKVKGNMDIELAIDAMEQDGTLATINARATAPKRP